MLFWRATRSPAVKPLKMWAVGCLGGRGALSFESWVSVCKLVLWGSWAKGVWHAKMYQESITRPYLMVAKALSWCRRRIFIGRCKSFSKKIKKNQKKFWQWVRCALHFAKCKMLLADVLQRMLPAKQPAGWIWALWLSEWDLWRMVECVSMLMFCLLATSNKMNGLFICHSHLSQRKGFFGCASEWQNE